jgi:hypothetical protein
MAHAVWCPRRPGDAQETGWGGGGGGDEGESERENFIHNQQVTEEEFTTASPGDMLASPISGRASVQQS